MHREEGRTAVDNAFIRMHESILDTLFMAQSHRAMNGLQDSNATQPTRRVPMISLALTLLPIAVTFTVATWHSPSDQLQPRSNVANCASPTPCKG